MRNSESTNNFRIRSFIRRQGRITQGQQLALARYWDKYCLSPSLALVPQEIFGRSAPLIIEIGFGNGDCLAQMAAAYPDHDYLGVEVHTPGVGRLIRQLEDRQITNARIYRHDAVEVLEKAIPDHSLSGIHLFFPDPWPKKKHHKRRIVRPEFVEIITRKLTLGGYFHAATDWEDYAENMLAVLMANNRLTNASASQTYCERPGYRPLTKFEQRGLNLGHGVWDLIFIRN